MLTYDEYAALSKTPHALADGLMLVFKHPADCRRLARYPSVAKKQGLFACCVSPLVHQFEICNKRPADDPVVGAFAKSLIVSGKICRTPARMA
jgi:hypothetical protein